MNITSNRPSVHFLIISSIALVWNIFGVFAYFGQMFMSHKVLSSLPKPELDYFLNMPIWVTASFAAAVFSGLFGAISLLFNKKSAVYLFLISIILILAHQYYIFFIQNHIKVEGLKLLLPLTTITFGLYLLWFSIKMNKKGVLN